MNVKIGKYQFFTGAPFWIGITRFKKSDLRRMLKWQMGLGFLRINKFRKKDE